VFDTDGAVLSPRDVAKEVVLRLVRRGADRLDFDLVSRGWYSPIPDVERLPEETWTHPSSLAGLDFDASAHLEHLERNLGAYIQEFEPPLNADPQDPTRFHLRNGSFEALDAHALYSTVRWAKPSTVLELGSGHSTLVSLQAIGRNNAEGEGGRIMTVDPAPPQFVRHLASHLVQIYEMSATKVPMRQFESLGAGDILFIDTTHVVSIGSEVNFLILEVLPRLRPGVLVHFHDVFLPWEYPRHWVRDLRYFWSEQYLLHAFLCFNATYDILLAAHHLSRTHERHLAHLVPSLHGSLPPASLWLRRNS
jgi:hypothetical protein